jgi:hypothetical protein
VSGLAADAEAADAPARELPFVDALAVLAALFLAYGLRAAQSPHYVLEWTSVAPFVRAALPVAVCALLLSAAALDLYGRDASTASARQLLAAAAYATAIAAAVGVFWGDASAPTAPLVLTAGVCLAGCLYGGRRLYWRRAGAKPR